MYYIHPFFILSRVFLKFLQKILILKKYYIKIVKKGRCFLVVDYMKQLNKIVKTIQEIPFEEVNISIVTKTDTYVINKKKENNIIGFRK